MSQRVENNPTFKKLDDSGVSGINSPMSSPDQINMDTRPNLSSSFTKPNCVGGNPTGTASGEYVDLDETAAKSKSDSTLISRFLPSVPSTNDSSHLSSTQPIGLPTPIPSPVAPQSPLQYTVRQPIYGYGTPTALGMPMEPSSAAVSRVAYTRPQFHSMDVNALAISPIVQQSPSLVYPCSYPGMTMPVVRVDTFNPSVHPSNQPCQPVALMRPMTTSLHDFNSSSSKEQANQNYYHMVPQPLQCIPVQGGALSNSGFSKMGPRFVTPMANWVPQMAASTGESDGISMRNAYYTSQMLSQSVHGGIYGAPYISQVPLSGSSHSAPATPGRKLNTPLPSVCGGKHKRCKPSKMQTQVLSAVFSHTCFPSTKVRTDLSRELGMSMRSVQVWFQNRRQSLRHKKNSEFPNSIDSGNLAVPISELVKQFKSEETSSVTRSESTSPQAVPVSMSHSVISTHCSSSTSSSTPNSPDLSSTGVPVHQPLPAVSEIMNGAPSILSVPPLL